MATKSRVFMVLALLLFAAVAWAGGSQEPAAAQPEAQPAIEDEQAAGEERAAERPTVITVTDSAGRMVELPYPVESVMITYSQLLLITKGVGVPDEAIVGLDEFTKNSYESIFTGLRDTETVGKNLFNLDVEKILEISPDVLISTSSTLRRNEGLEAQLDAVGIKFVGLDFDWENVSDIITTLGRMFGEETEAQAAEFDEFWWSAIDAVSERVNDLPEEERRTVYWENTASGYTTVGKGSANHEMLALAGGLNIAGILEERSPKVDPEWIITQDPDVIMKYPMGADYQGGFGATEIEPFQAMIDELVSRPGFEQIDAVREGEVYIVSALIKTGAFQNIAVLYIAKLLYPELFADLDPQATLREMAEEYMGLDWEDVRGVFVYPEPTD